MGKGGCAFGYAGADGLRRGGPGRRDHATHHIRQGCRRLAELSHTALLGVEFTTSSAGPWTFAGATPMPDLRLGGEALLDALASAPGVNRSYSHDSALWDSLRPPLAMVRAQRTIWICPMSCSTSAALPP